MVTLSPEQHIHLIGIGGAGMSAIARVLHLQGYRVSGSDLHTNDVTAHLRALGMTVHHGHAAQHISADVDVVITSSAIPSDHVEIATAKAQAIPVYKRHDVMEAIMAGNRRVAVAGTHGKTTTTAMIGHILTETGRDPSYIVGGVLANTGYNADVGQGAHFVIEADEYDNMFHGLRPHLAVLTSFEYDHPDFFETPQAMRDSFAQFVARVPADGLMVTYAGDADALALVRQHTPAPIVTYALDDRTADWHAHDLQYAGDQLKFAVQQGDQRLGIVTLQVPGEHNVLNAMAALIIAQHEGVPIAEAILALASFKGAGRRFDVRAIVDDIIVIDDYAHHPTAIRTTITAARRRYPAHTLWTIWQPHTYSRTRQLWDAYLTAFSDAHHVLITDVYAAREAPDAAVDIAHFVEQLQHDHAQHAPTHADAVAHLRQHVTAPAVILIMSAGDAPQIGIDYLQQLKADSS